MNNGLETIISPTINGLKSLNLDTLDVDTLQSNNIDGDFFSINTIETSKLKIDDELDLTSTGFITIGNGTPEEVTISDIEISYLDGLTSNIQTQINNSTVDVSQLRIDLTEAQDDINDNQSLLGIQGATIDDLYVKTILQSASSIDQKTTFSGKLILSSLSDLDVGVDLQAATTNIGILTTQQSTNTSAISNNTSSISTNTTNISSNLSKINTNTSNISSLSTQQTTNTSNIQTNTLSIGQTSGPVNSLFHRVQNITGASTATYNYKTFRQLNSGNSNTTQITLNEGTISIEGDLPAVRMYKTGDTNGESSYIAVGPNSQLQIQNYQQNKDILIATAGTTAQIDINSNNVYINTVDVIAKFNTIDSDILGNSNAITSSNVNIQNNLSKITTNTNSINDLQTKVAPVGSIMMYAGSNAPSGWYICNGALISKTSNIELWSLLGNTYLAGRSAQSLSFYLPDLRQLFITGAGDNSTYAITATNKSVGDYNAQSIMDHGHNYERPTNTFKASQSTFGTNVWRSNTQSTTSGGVILPGGGGVSTGNK